MATIRAFICIELPADLRQQLLDMQTQLRSLGHGVSWVKPDGIHLTLKFLGDVEAGQMDAIAEAVGRAAADIADFAVTVQGLGAFPNFRRPRVLWAGIQEQSGLLKKLQHQIEIELAHLGYPREERDFSPHLTLGRVKDSHQAEAIISKFQQMRFTPVVFSAGSIIVMRSDLKSDGAVYSPMRTIEL